MYLVYFKDHSIEIEETIHFNDGDDVVMIPGGYVVQVEAETFVSALLKAQQLVKKFKETYERV